MKYKIIYYLIVFLLSVLCASKQSAEEVVEISFWQFLVPEHNMRKILDEFEVKYPNIKVNMQQLNWRDGFDKITTSIATGVSFDVCELGSTWVANFASMGLLYDMSDYMQDIEHEFIPEFLTALKWENKYYGVPLVTGTRVLYYNKDIFIKAGLQPDKPPATWRELELFTGKISLNCKGVYPFGLPVGETSTPWQAFIPFLWSGGGDIFDKDNKTIIVDSIKNIQIMDFYKRLAKHSMLSRQAYIDMDFAKGKIGMIISGGWNLGLINRINPNMNFGVALIPADKNNKPTSFLGGEALSILASTKHPKEAKLLIDFLTAPEQQIKITTFVPSFIPTRKTALHKNSFLPIPFRDVFIEQMQSSKSPPPHPKWAQIEEEISWAIEEALFEKLSSKDVMSRLRKSIESLVAKDIFANKDIHNIDFTKYVLIITIVILLVFFTACFFTYKFKYSLIKQCYPFYVFLVPWFLLFVVFYFFPFIYSLFLSFMDYSPLYAKSSFCALGNYYKIFHDPEFIKSLLNTFYFAVITCPISLVLALFCASIIYKKVPFYRWIQAGIFAPISVSVIVAATIFSYFCSSEGFFNSILDFLCLPKPIPDNWLLNPSLSLVSVMIMNIWCSFGLYMVIFTAGLHSIPKEILEASMIDGAGSFHRFWHIILPSLKPFILLVIVLNTVKVFQVFPEIFTMTQGGPHGTSSTLVYYLYKTGFHQFDMGKASAVGYILFLITGVLSALQVWLVKKEDIYEK